MRTWLVDLLVCPNCADARPLTLETADARDGEIETGRLVCAACGTAWPVRGGIPRFVAEADDYAANFAIQWNRWRTVQIDRLGGHRLSEERLLGDTGWERTWFRGRLILDAGCGAGRFADVMAGFGARVVAVDLSAAVDACGETCAVHDGRVQCVQASIYALPLRRAAFDGVHCAGVIQHTPDPARTIAVLPAFLKPGGRLAYNFYEKDLARRLQLVKYGLRRLTPDLSPTALLWLSRVLVALFFPVTVALSRIRFVRYVIRFLPICATHNPALDLRQQYRWTLLDTFDWYGPRYEFAQDHREVAAQLRAAGLEAVTARPGVARGRRPGGDAPL